MNLFGIGLPEMGVLGVIALLIFGPDKLPEVMGQAGKLVKDFRNMTSGLTGEFEKTMAEAKEMTNGLSKELGGMAKEVNSVSNSVKKDLNKATGTNTTTNKVRPASKSSDPKASGMAKSGSTSGTSKPRTVAQAAASTNKSGSSKIVPATPKASKEDPIADISLFDVTPVERTSRARKATPSVIGDPTPRLELVPQDGTDAELADALAHGDVVASSTVTTSDVVVDDALARARARRRSAGYAKFSA